MERITFSEADLLQDKKPLVQIVRHRQDSLSLQISQQIVQSLEYAKFNYQISDLGILDAGLSIHPDVRVLVLATERLENTNPDLTERLIEFAANGNTLLLARPFTDDRIAYLQGMKSGVSPQFNNEARGIKDVKGIFPGFKGKSFYEQTLAPHLGLQGNVFREEMEIIATAVNETDFPVVLRQKIGAGNVYVFNSLGAQNKLYRGTLFSILLTGLEGMPYSVVNGGTIFLDDFPAPLYEQMMEPIKQEYGVSHAQFVSNIWWPDMKAMADSLEITYTAIPAFNYNANVVPPFDFYEWEMGKIKRDGSRVEGSIWLARDVSQSKHELGFHGYNHFSLWERDWPDQQFMISSLQSVKKRWMIDNLGKLPVTYVPPTNYIDETGIEALVKGMPSIRYMASLYLGEVETGGNREFGPDPYSPRLFDFPRITSGFVNSDNSWFQQHSLYLLTGVWNHFIHPDDVFQIGENDKDPFKKRNPKELGWKSDEEYGYGLYQVFRRRILETRRQYPFIRLEKARTIAPRTLTWRQRHINYRCENGLITITNLGGRKAGEPQNELVHYFMYVPDDLETRYRNAIEAQSITMASVPVWEGKLYQFKSQKERLIFPDAAPRYLLSSNARNLSERDALNAYKEYNRRVEEEQLVQEQQEQEPWRDRRLENALAAYDRKPSSLETQDRVIELSEEFNRIPLAIDVLEKRMLRDSVWQKQDIERLVKYYGWQSAASRGWEFTEQLWGIAPPPFVLAMYSQLRAAFGTPQAFDMRYTWFERKVDHGDQSADSLRKAFVRQNRGPDHWPYVRPQLLKLIKQHPSSDSLYHYTLQRSIWYDSPDSTIAMHERYPEQNYPQLQPLADEIAYIYAYEKQQIAKALWWARRTDQVPHQTKLQWMANQGRYAAYINYLNQEIKSTGSDSLQIQVIHQLFDTGYYSPLLEWLSSNYGTISETPAAVRETFYERFQYMDQQEKLSLTRSYASYLGREFLGQYRIDQRVANGEFAEAYANYTGDNFDNISYRFGMRVSLRDGNSVSQEFGIERIGLRSTINTNDFTDNLYQLNYKRYFSPPESSWRYGAGAGLSVRGGYAHATFNVETAYLAPDYTQIQLNYRPIWTNTAVARNYSRLRASIYREQPLENSRMRITGNAIGRLYLSGASFLSTQSGNSFSFNKGAVYPDSLLVQQNVIHMEGTGRFYYTALEQKGMKLEGILEVTYADATRTITSGIPYWTPDNLWIGGGGVGYSWSTEYDSYKSAQLSGNLFGKMDNQEGIYVTAELQGNWQFHPYWRLSVSGSRSTSATYQSNQILFSVRHTFQDWNLLE